VSVGRTNLAPVEIRASLGGAAIDLVWQDGTTSRLTAAVLRTACRCAACTAARARGNEVAAGGDMTIGGYAVNISFSDGHARGIYPWPFLRELCGR
jgi:prepilin-type processing-associated H-X9-DG protein